MLTSQCGRLNPSNRAGGVRLLLGCCWLSVLALGGCLPQELIQNANDERKDEPGAEAPADIMPVRVKAKPNRPTEESPVFESPEVNAPVVRGAPKFEGPGAPVAADSAPSAVAMSEGRFDEPRRPIGTGGTAEIQRSQPRSSAPSSSSPPRTNGNQSTAGSTGSDTKNKDPNAAKIEVYLQGWLSAEHKDEVESFLIRRREATTFEADRYHTMITTTGDHSYNVVVDVYHSGKIRVFNSQKLY